MAGAATSSAGEGGRRLRLAPLLLLALASAARAQEVPEDAIGLYPYRVLPVDAVRGHLMEGEFREPVAVFFDDAAGELFVANSKRGLIGIFDPEGIPIFAFGGRSLLVDPKHVEARPDGTIYVLDADQTAVKAFNYRGEPLPPVRFERPEVDGAPGGTVEVATFTIDREGRWYVADVSPPQILVYDADLRFQFAIRSERRRADLEVISRIAVGPDGTIAVVDLKAKPVQLFSSKGRFLLGFGERDIGMENFTAPISVGWDAEGFLYVVDLLRHQVKVFDATGKLLALFGSWYTPESGGRLPGELLYPSDIAFGPNGLFYVAERFGQRVQIFRRQPLSEPAPERTGLRIPKIEPLDRSGDGR